MHVQAMRKLRQGGDDKQVVNFMWPYNEDGHANLSALSADTDSTSILLIS